jgi:enterochelin esterase family protein
MKSLLLERAQREGTPLIDCDGAECAVTFLWQGKNPSALTGDFNFWAGDGASTQNASLALEQTERAVWTKTLKFPRDAYVEYVFLKNGKRVNDPLNARKSQNGVGGINNYFYAPAAHPTPFLKTARNVPRGRVTTHVFKADGVIIGNQRRVHLYQPPTDEPAALLVALDGQDYLRRAKLPTMLDNLFAQHKIPPLAVAMLESSRLAKGSARMSEYACNELTLIVLLRGLIPFAQQHLRLLNWKKARGAYGIMGASMGGLMSLFTALRAPEIFGTAISHAGAYDLGGYAPSVFTLAAQAKTKPRVWLDVGQMDWLLASNRRMHRMLQRSKFDVNYREYYAYHNWPAWRDVLPDALTWAFAA